MSPVSCCVFTLKYVRTERNMVKACIVVQLGWKGLWSLFNHMKVQIKKWTSEAYLDTSTVVRHPRGQGYQHCNVGQKQQLELNVNKKVSRCDTFKKRDWNRAKTLNDGTMSNTSTDLQSQCWHIHTAETWQRYCERVRNSAGYYWCARQIKLCLPSEEFLLRGFISPVD